MKKYSLAGAMLALGTLAGCAGHDPADHVIYRNEPLVKQVEHGMSSERVLTIGGQPSSQMVRSAHPGGTCNNYVLNHEGRKQVYYVSFDSRNRVDGKGFKTCEQLDEYQSRHH